MKQPPRLPVQFHTNLGIGLRLVNGAMRKRLRLTTGATRRLAEPRNLTGDVLADTITLASAALLRHIKQLIHQKPLRTITEGSRRTRIRVCGALDYVIDREQRRVWVEPTPLSRSERISKLRPPWANPFSMPMENIDILNTLCRSAWLIHVASRPDWFGYAFSTHEEAQSQLFVQAFDIALALEQVTHRVHRQMADDPNLLALRHQLATELTLQLGPGLVNTAMRSRTQTSNGSLNACHLNLVWRHRAAFETMERENPLLLPALTAWLRHARSNETACLPDALPLMRRDVLATGLPPKAWRYLAQHGMKRILPAQHTGAPWKDMLTMLQTLHAARWPALPPRNFLRLLQDTAGRPDTYNASDHGVPGWFWQMACNDAEAKKSDTRAYRELFDCIPDWAWLVREFGLSPDSNQRRKGILWLRDFTKDIEQFPPENDAPAWAHWLLEVPWREVHPMQIVPILSPNALRREAVALHNCADSYIDRCQDESNLLLSLRDPATGRRVALMCLERSGTIWQRGQVAGPCNTPVKGWVEKTADQVAALVSRFYSRFRLAREPPVIDDNRN